MTDWLVGNGWQSSHNIEKCIPRAAAYFVRTSKSRCPLHGKDFHEDLDGNIGHVLGEGEGMNHQPEPANIGVVVKIRVPLRSPKY